MACPRNAFGCLSCLSCLSQRSHQPPGYPAGARSGSHLRKGDGTVQVLLLLPQVHPVIRPRLQPPLRALREAPRAFCLLRRRLRRSCRLLTRHAGLCGRVARGIGVPLTLRGDAGLREGGVTT
jgi:hypothetical protein